MQKYIYICIICMYIHTPSHTHTHTHTQTQTQTQTHTHTHKNIHAHYVNPHDISHYYVLNRYQMVPAVYVSAIVQLWFQSFIVIVEVRRYQKLRFPKMTKRKENMKAPTKPHDQLPRLPLTPSKTPRRRGLTAVKR